MTTVMRYMHLHDIKQVAYIDRASFKPAWSEQSYAYEVAQAPSSHMLVLCEASEEIQHGWRRFIRPFSPSYNERILGYAGMWMIADEAHISTIASHPDERGKGIGEALLATLIRKALIKQSAYIVLEVRVSNHIAQNLYHKYGFQVADTRRSYYHDNNEDAYDMRLDLSDPQHNARLLERYTAIQAKFAFIDQFSDSARPPIIR